jgi:putative tricarboxylic transport membrane protein
MLTLGIPGDSVTAVILGSFYMHGLMPGPTFMIREIKYFYLIVAFLVIGTIFSYIFGIFGSNVMLKMLKLPKWYMVPIISILCIIGSYALQNSINDIIFMLAFGVLGYVFERSGYPVGPIVLGIILGPMIETNFRQALINTGSLSNLLTSFVARPICLILLLLIIGSFVFQSKTLKKFEDSAEEIRGDIDA